MISVDDARARAGSLLRRKLRSWAADLEIAQFSLALQPPTEREALADLDGVMRWRDAWRQASSGVGISVDWIERSWPSVGRQRVPQRLTIAGADAIAEFAGGAERAAWKRSRDRAGDVLTHLGQTDAVRAAVRTHGTRLAEYSHHDLSTVLDVVAWLAENPATGYRPRQVPIRGVDSKWLSANRTIVTALVAAVTGTPTLGLIDADPLMRVRMLDPSLLRAGPLDFAAPVAELATLPLTPRVLLVLENLESVLALPPIPGVIAVHGSGYAVGAISRIPWAASAPILYWGDLDSNGFAVLHVLRSHHQHVTSVLMDTDTLLTHRDLWVPEPTPATGTYGTLTRDEQRTLEHLRAEGNARLEQERIPWESYALPRLSEAINASL